MISICLPSGDTFGWGVCGAKLRAALAKETVIIDVPLNGVAPPIVTEWPMLQAVQGANFLPLNPNAWSRTRNIGFAFVEDRATAQKYLPNVERYFDHIVAGSYWCADMIRDLGVPSVSVAIQGVDTELFKPPTERPERETFNIFSGGKFEYRKGQDLAIAAFKHMMQKYPDVHLLASWANQWPQTMDSMMASRHIKYDCYGYQERERASRRTLELNEIPEDRYTLLPLMKNSEMPSVYVRADVGVFPNRCEAGTNMVMCETMACGVPVVASRRTGHSDIITAQNSFPISDGRFNENGWFEPSLDEVISQLECAYENRDRARAVGLIGAEYMRRLTWERTAQSLIQACLPQTN